MDNVNQVICEKRSYSKEFQSHQHEFGQFLFPLQGSLDLQTKWQEVHLNPDHCFFLPPMCDHNYRSLDRNEFLILDISPQHLPEDTSCMHIRLDEQWTSIRYLLLQEEKSRESTSSLLALTRYITSKLQITNHLSIDYIHKHYKELIKLDTLANIENYHPVYYSAWFKKKTGKSPKAYITELRLKEAKHLLVSTVRSMTNISGELGFENSSSFTRWFVSIEGMSPQKYRNLHNG